MPEMQRFTWIQTHNELVDYLKTMRDKQDELIKLLSTVKVKALDYTNAQKQQQRISKIDPFSFFLMIYKYGSNNSLEILQDIANRLQIFVPSDISGYIRAYVQSTWLVGYQGSDNSSEINKLWDFFFAILEDRVTDKLFAETKAITGMGLIRLSASMYLIAPERFLPVNKYTTSYLHKEYGIKQNKKYLELLSSIKAKTNAPFYEILEAAYQSSSGSKTIRTNNIPKGVDMPVLAQGKLNQYPLNLILYGPPGTGKTYNTILRAAEIVEGCAITDIDKAKEVFNRELGNRIEFITFHQNYSYEDFIQGLRPDVQEKGSLSFTKRDGVFMRCCVNALFEYYKFVKDVYEDQTYESKKDLLSTIELQDLHSVSKDVLRYVIVIDEINRANMSRVFGELITLIEPDKRSHGEIPLKCTLPSGDEFMVPSNLYIIGTMNTADKSLALLDIALRRRFEFEAMYPLYNISGYDIHDVEILTKINEKIAKKKGCDYQIGHSYFMGKEYNRVKQINSKVIPLLMEYFMNDRKEIIEILHYAGLEIEDDTWPLKIKA